MTAAKKRRLLKLCELLEAAGNGKGRCIITNSGIKNIAHQIGVSATTLYGYLHWLSDEGIADAALPEDGTVIIQNTQELSKNCEINKYLTTNDTPITPIKSTPVLHHKGVTPIDSVTPINSRTPIKSTPVLHSTTPYTYVKPIFPGNLKTENSTKSQHSKQSRLPDRGAKLPAKASSVAKEEHKFPYVSKKGRPLAVQTSAIWYWAVERYRKHGLDFQLTGAIFGKMAVKYDAGISSKIGKDWEINKAYIDWYLGSYDEFIRGTTKYSFDFMVSTAALNKFLQRDFGTTKIIESDEARTAHHGKWVK